jgi:hypothetical protein
MKMRSHKQSGGRRTAKNKKMRGGDDQTQLKNDVVVMKTTKISTQPNNDPSYTEIGLVHLSDSRGINAIRGTITAFSNLFGARGFDNRIYDDLRMSTLDKLKASLEDDQKICNLRMDFENPMPDLLYHHVYGTLLQKRSQAKPPPPPPPLQTQPVKPL